MIKPSEIRAASNKVEKENMQFRSYLKRTADSDELDQRFHDLHEELFSGYDCSECRNCCRDYTSSFSPPELEKAAECLKMSIKDFSKCFIDNGGTKSYDLLAAGPPCVFLRDGGKCLIEGARPIDCCEFPYTNKSEMITRLRGIMEYAAVCPVVFEVIERLKRIYGYTGSLR